MENYLNSTMPSLSDGTISPIDVFQASPFIFVAIAGLPLLFLLNKSLMNLLTSSAINFPRTTLLILIPAIFLVAVVLVSFTLALQVVSSPWDISLMVIFVKWLLVSGACSSIFLPLFILPPRKAPMKIEGKLTVYQGEDFRLVSKGYLVLYHLLILLNIATALGLVLITLRHSAEKVYSAETWLYGASIGWTYWTITGFFLHILRVNTIRPSTSINLSSPLTNNEEEYEDETREIRETTRSVDMYLSEYFSYHVRSKKCKHSIFEYCRTCNKKKIAETKAYIALYYVTYAVIFVAIVYWMAHILIIDIKKGRIESLVGFLIVFCVNALLVFVLNKLLRSHWKEKTLIDKSKDSVESSSMSFKSSSIVNMGSSSIPAIIEASTEALAPRKPTTQTISSRHKKTLAKTSTPLSEGDSRATTANPVKESADSSPLKGSSRGVSSKSILPPVRPPPPTPAPPPISTTIKKLPNQPSSPIIETMFEENVDRDPKGEMTSSPLMKTRKESNLGAFITSNPPVLTKAHEANLNKENEATLVHDKATESPLIHTSNENTNDQFSNLEDLDFIESEAESELEDREDIILHRSPEIPTPQLQVIPTPSSVLSTSTIISFIKWFDSPECLNPVYPIFEVDQNRQYLAPELLSLLQTFLKKYNRVVFLHLSRWISTSEICPSRFDPAKASYYGRDNAEEVFRDTVHTIFSVSFEWWSPNFESTDDVRKFISILNVIRGKVKQQT